MYGSHMFHYMCLLHVSTICGYYVWLLCVSSMCLTMFVYYVCLLCKLSMYFAMFVYYMCILCVATKYVYKAKYKLFRHKTETNSDFTDHIIFQLTAFENRHP